MYDYEEYEKQRIATKPRIANEFLYSTILYPTFKFQHPMSIFVVGPTNSGKRFRFNHILVLDDLMLQAKDSCIEAL